MTPIGVGNRGPEMAANDGFMRHLDLRATD
jgi:hypothetical protein